METMDAIQAAFASKFDLAEVVRNNCDSCPGEKGRAVSRTVRLVTSTIPMS